MKSKHKSVIANTGPSEVKDGLKQDASHSDAQIKVSSKKSPILGYRSLIKNSPILQRALVSPAMTRSPVVPVQLTSSINQPLDALVESQTTKRYSESTHQPTSPRKAKQKESGKGRDNEIEQGAKTDRSSIRHIMKKLADAAYGQGSVGGENGRASINNSSHNDSLDGTEVNMRSLVVSLKVASSSSSLGIMFRANQVHYK